MALNEVAKTLDLTKHAVLKRRHLIEIELSDSHRALGGAANRAGDRGRHDCPGDQGENEHRHRQRCRRVSSLIGASTARVGT